MNVFYDRADGYFYAPCAVCGEPVWADDRENEGPFSRRGYAVLGEPRDEGQIPVTIVHIGGEPPTCLDRWEAIHGAHGDHHLEVMLAQIVSHLGLTVEAYAEIVKNRRETGIWGMSSVKARRRL